MLTKPNLYYVCRVNPVSGYAEPQRPSPFAGMSEEQKEHEAVKLANIIDRLHSLGVVKPGKLGKIVDIIYIGVCTTKLMTLYP